MAPPGSRRTRPAASTPFSRNNFSGPSSPWRPAARQSCSAIPWPRRSACFMRAGAPPISRVFGPRPSRPGAPLIPGPPAAARSANTSLRTSPGVNWPESVGGPGRPAVGGSMTGIIIRRTVAIGTLAFGLAWAAAPAFAQSGQIKGKVSAEGVLVEGATVLIENLDNGSKPLTTKTNKKGEYIQVGLYPGKYKITVQKDALSSTKNVDIHLDMLTLDVKLEAGGGAKATGSKEDVAKAKARADAMTKAFSDGVALSNEGKTDEAVAKFNEV